MRCLGPDHRRTLLDDCLTRHAADSGCCYRLAAAADWLAQRSADKTERRVLRKTITKLVLGPGHDPGEGACCGVGFNHEGRNRHSRWGGRSSLRASRWPKGSVVTVVAREEHGYGPWARCPRRFGSHDHLTEAVASARRGGKGRRALRALQGGGFFYEGHGPESRKPRSGESQERSDCRHPSTVHRVAHRPYLSSTSA